MLNEKKLTKAELDKREDLILKMKKNKRSLVKKYGKDAEKVMYGRATNIAKKQAESMENTKIREMIKSALSNPKAADLNKDGKLSDYEEKRGAAIEKNLDESSSTEEKRIAKMAIKKLAKYRGVSEDEARQDLLRAAKELGDLKETQITEENIGLTEDKVEALMELRNILDELQVLGDQARDIIAQNFPSYLSKGEAYGAFDLGSSTNRYDTTIASIVDEIEEYGEEEDEDEDMMQEDMDLGHQDNEPHMLKGDLYRIGKYAMELYQMVDGFEGQGEVDFPHWWQSKVIKAKDYLVGAKHYLDFELKEPQIDAMVDVAQDVEAIDEAAGKFVVRPCSNPGTPFAVWQTSKDGENDKRIEGFKTKEDAQKFADEKNSLKEEEVGKADMVASAIQKAMNKHKGDESKTYQLQQARKAMNKGDLDKAEKIAKRLAEKLKSN